LIWAVFISKESYEWENSRPDSSKISAIGSALRRRTWGTGSRKNLMRTCLECRSIRSMPWAVKKASLQSEVVYDEHKATTVTSKSTFLPEEPERRILRGYCRGDRPKNAHLYILG